MVEVWHFFLKRTCLCVPSSVKPWLIVQAGPKCVSLLKMYTDIPVSQTVIEDRIHIQAVMLIWLV